MANKTKYLFLIIIIFSLVVPEPALAFIGTGLFDFFDTALEGIEEKAGPIVAKLIALFFTYVLGLIALITSTALLEMTMNPEWLSLQGNSMVDAGWHFTAGLANMFIVLILIVIAFGFIFKIETFQAKKALPRLLIVALLINFSLVFIGMLVDVANILQNTFFQGNEKLPSQVVESLGVGGQDVFWQLGAWLVSLAVVFIIPFVAPFAQLALVLLVLGAGFLPNIVIWVLQIVSFFIVSSIFLVYAVLFAARIFIIYFLAILAPLAFLAFILPQTKKYFDRWLHTLLEWTFLGIFLFFFLAIGLRAVQGLLPPGSDSPPTFISWVNIGEYFIYYLFLVIFLAVAAIFSKKMMPAFAQAIVDQAAGLGKMFWGGAVVPFGRAAKSRLQQLAVKQKQKEQEIKTRERAGERVKLSRTAKLGMGMGRWARRGVEFAHRAAGTTPAAAIERSLDQKVSKYEKRYGKDFVGAASALNEGWIRSNFDKSAMTLYLEKTKGGKALGELSAPKYLEGVEAVAEYAPHRLEDIAKHRLHLFDEKGTEQQQRVTKLAQSVMVKREIEEDENVKKILDTNVEIDGTPAQELKSTAEGRLKLIKEAFYKKAVDALKNEDIDTLTDEALNDLRFQEAVIRYKPINFIKKIGEEKGSIYIRKIGETMERLGAKEIDKTNNALLRSILKSPGMMSILPKIKGAETEYKINALTRRVKKGGREAIVPEYRALRSKIGDISFKIKKRPKKETIKEQEKLTTLKKEADKIWGTITKDEDLYKQYREAEGLTQIRYPKPPKEKPSQQQGPSPSGGPLPKTSPPTSLRTPRKPPPTPEGPAWLVEGIKKTKEGTIPTMMPKKLENFLHSHGLSRKEIAKLTPEQAWSKAEEIFRESKK